MSHWLRNKIQELERAEGYVMPESAPDESELIDEWSPAITKLDANENALLPREFVDALARSVIEEVDPRYYSKRSYWKLVLALGQHLGLGPEHIVLGNGGDQIIDFIAATFLNQGEKAVSISPTYSFYRLRAKLAGAGWNEVPLNNDFSLDVGRILEAARDARVIFLCSPNNPTGNQFDATALMEVITRFDGIVFIDEAYADFADETVAGWVRRYQNLVVLRTFSKAFGLAGLRIGSLLAHPTVAGPFWKKVQYPYPVSSYSLVMGLKLLANFDVVKSAIDRMKTERDRLIRELESIPGMRPFPSQGNFVLFHLDFPVEPIHRALKEHGIFVKNVGPVLRYENCLRATVGTAEMNDRLIESLRRLSAKEGRL